jgi:hypothetical protein
MADRNPGTPLNPDQVSGAQGIPTDTILVQSHVMHVGNGEYHMCTPALIPVPVQHAQYSAHDVPFQKQQANYKP